jgi:hypothetical protein
MKEIIYTKRPLKVELDETTKTFIDIMNSVAPECGSHWSFSGGFARDLWLGKPWNDYDVCLENNHLAAQRLEEMGLLEKGVQEENEIPHDYYVDPYSFNKEKRPIHWIHADNGWAYAPKHFDFSINQICLKPDGYFHAPTLTWRDLDRGIIRKVAERMTTNLAMRAIRFACKYDFTLHETMVEQLKQHISTPMDTLLLIRNANKMVEDGVGDKCLELMKSLDWPDTKECEAMTDYLRVLNNLVVTGQGHREPEGGGHYNDW